VTPTAQRLQRIPRPRPLGILAASLALVAVTVLAGSVGLGGHPSSPGRGADLGGGNGPAGNGLAAADPAPVTIPGTGAALPAKGSLAQLDHNIGVWTANLAANPKDFLSATNLATLYQARARLTADLGDYERGLEAARTAQAIVKEYAPARLAEAAILYSLHDFGGALAAADDLYRADPSQLAALATRADAELELGRIDAARSDLTTLAAATAGPGVEIRQARLAAVTGDLAGALRLARQAHDDAAADGTESGFYAYALGEYARLAGDPSAARAAFAEALAIRSTDLGALLGSARIAAFDGDLDAAISALEQATAIAPTPDAETLLGDLLTARVADPARDRADVAADRAAAKVAYGTVALTRTLSELAGSVYDRQLLAFDLDHGGATAATLDAARAALAVRGDAPGHDLVAWALHRLGRDHEAQAEIDAARATGAADARLLFHAGAIAAALGHSADAADLLDRALALGPALDPNERTEATGILAELGSGM
jgi:hypothetical protein